MYGGIKLTEREKQEKISDIKEKGSHNNEQSEKVIWEWTKNKEYGKIEKKKTKKVI